MKYDLVITDMTMPGITGAKLAKIFRDLRKNIPIIICTGFVNPEFSEKLLGIEINEILLKPLGINALSKAVQKYLPSGKQNT
jgi:YesN/AraC family two-component response regulator